MTKMFCVNFGYNTWQSLLDDIKQQWRRFFTWDPVRRCWVSRFPASEEAARFLSKQFPQFAQYFSYSQLHITTNIPNFLYPFQRDAVRKILAAAQNGERGFGLFWDVGCGKTITSAVAALLLSQQHNNTPIIILCPSSLIQQWKEEIIKFNLTTNDNIQIIKAPKQKRMQMWQHLKLFNITTYETWRADCDEINHSSIIYILDEASKLKNGRAKITQKAKAHITKARFRILLTATPFETHVMNYFNITTIISPERIDLKSFLNEHCVWEYNEWAGKEVIIGGKNFDLYSLKIADISDFKKKEDVRTELPPFIETTRYVETTTQQWEVAKELIRNAEGKVFHVFQLLRVLDNGIEELKESSSEYLPLDIQEMKENISPKLQALDEAIEELNGHQVLIFTSFVRSAKRIYTYLKRQGKSISIYTGEQKNDEALQLFKEGKLQILVATDSLAYGISFPDVDYLINYDYHPNPAKLHQRKGRIHRINSTRPKTAINFIGSIVEKRLLALANERMSEKEKMEKIVKELRNEVKT